jgi:hypothetical protein
LAPGWKKLSTGVKNVVEVWKVLENTYLEGPIETLPNGDWVKANTYTSGASSRSGIAIRGIAAAKKRIVDLATGKYDVKYPRSIMFRGPLKDDTVMISGAGCGGYGEWEPKHGPWHPSWCNKPKAIKPVDFTEACDKSRGDKWTVYCYVPNLASICKKLKPNKGTDFTDKIDTDVMMLQEDLGGPLVDMLYSEPFPKADWHKADGPEDQFRKCASSLEKWKDTWDYIDQEDKKMRKTLEDGIAETKLYEKPEDAWKGYPEHALGGAKAGGGAAP